MKKILLIASLILSLKCGYAQWSELGGMNGLAANGGIYSICNDTSGNIYASGWFNNTNGKQYVAKYNGNTWSELGGISALSANSIINSICIDAAGNVYAAGYFTNTSGNYVAKYNGTTWSVLGGINATLINNTIESMCIDAAGNIYVAGDLNRNGYRYVAKYDGSGWSELGGFNSLSADDGIISICSDAAGNIYAAGAFTNASGNKYVAKYNGSNWSELGGTNALFANSFIYSICSDNANNIYAAGVFKNASGNRYVAKFDGSIWSELGGTNALSANYDIFCIYSDAAGNIYAGGNFTNGVTNASGKQYVAKYTPILPLKLLSFKAKQENNKVLLNWQTANEVNVSHINIQRSNNGNEFTTIGKANAACCSYEFIDDIRNLEFGIRNLYYRLEMVDKDGSKTYSEIRNVELGIRNVGISIYPNPAKDQVTIECSGARELLIIDYLGKEVYRKKIINNQESIINVQRFSKGIYVVKAIMNNGDTKTEKLVLE